MPAIHSINPTFTIFRKGEAVDFDASGVMTVVGEPTLAEAEGTARAYEAGFENGHQLKLLFAMPGMSLTHVWFKSGFPLPRHSHDADCLYYIIGGSVKLGSEMLGPGDGFFVGSNVPYTYTPGEDGVQLLEIRTAEKFDFRLMADNPAFWDRALATLGAKQEVWAVEGMPAD